MAIHSRRGCPTTEMLLPLHWRFSITAAADSTFSRQDVALHTRAATSQASSWHGVWRRPRVVRLVVSQGHGGTGLPHPRKGRATHRRQLKAGVDSHRFTGFVSMCSAQGKIKITKYIIYTSNYTHTYSITYLYIKSNI